MLKALLFFSAAIYAQQTCGLSGKCGQNAPCCSEYGICGSTPLHCGGGCQSLISFSTTGEGASCYQDRPSIQAQKCISGVYDMGPNTWIQNTDSWNGDNQAADFTIDSNQIANFQQGTSGSKLFLRPPADTRVLTNAGMGVKISSTSYMMYGSFSIKLTSGSAPGMVTSFISMSDVKDEIDWEWTGGDLMHAQTNIFSKGVIDYTKGSSYLLTASSVTTSRTYTVDWNADRIIFSIDGIAVRTYTKAANLATYPSTASRIQLAVWDGGSGPVGTRNWAGGYINWATGGASGFSATVTQVTLQCAGDAVPSSLPARPLGYLVPTLKDTPLKIAVNGLAGSDYFPVGNPKGIKLVTGTTTGGSSGNGAGWNGATSGAAGQAVFNGQNTADASRLGPLFVVILLGMALM